MQKIYKTSKKSQHLFLGLGIASIIGGLVVAPGLLTFGGIFIIAYFLNSNLEVIRFHDDYFEFKLAPIRSRVQVINKHLQNIESDDKNFTLFVKGDDEQIKEHKIPLTIFEPDEKQQIIDQFKSLIKS